MGHKRGKREGAGNGHLGRFGDDVRLLGGQEHRLTKSHQGGRNMDVNARKALPQVLNAHLQMHLPCRAVKGVSSHRTKGSCTWVTIQVSACLMITRKATPSFHAGSNLRT